jgi:lambda repressor-like predicted transcriptional regulator
MEFKLRKEHGGLSFRHFYDFNIAMLGMQGWKLLANHDTILSKVFKAKYYQNARFIDATLGHNPSYVWCSIHAS